MQKIYVDGGVSHNGNYRGQQVARICVHDESRLLADEFVGDKTSNEAELLAIRRAFELATSPTVVVSDSQLAVNLVNRRWKASKPHLRELLKSITIPEGFEVVWVRREENLAGQYLENRYQT